MYDMKCIEQVFRVNFVFIQGQQRKILIFDLLNIPNQLKVLHIIL